VFSVLPGWLPFRHKDLVPVPLLLLPLLLLPLLRLFSPPFTMALRMMRLASASKPFV
jgi:hypothetical protein